MYLVPNSLKTILYLEDRLVAAALIPPNVIKMTSNEVRLNAQLSHDEDPMIMSRSELFTMSDKKGEKTILQVKEWYNEKPK